MGKLLIIVRKGLVISVISFAIMCGLVENCNAIMRDAFLVEGEMLSGQMEMFSQNNITFYDPDECLSVNGGSGGASLLSGNTTEERIWNYLVNAGIAGVSDKPEVIAGIMGNFFVESNYNPFQIGSGGLPYHGLWMESDTVAQGLELARRVNDAVGKNYWGFYKYSSQENADEKVISKVGASREEIDIAIDASMKLLFEKTTWKWFLEGLGEVENSSGLDGVASYAELFMGIVENCFDGGGTIHDAKVRAYVAKKWMPHSTYQMRNERVQAAQSVYNRLAGVSAVNVVNNGEGGNGLSVADVTSPDITLIGDSIAMQSEKELMAKFPNGFFSKVGSRHSTSAGGCPGDEGGLSVLQKLSSGSGTVINQHWTGDCESVAVSPYSLTKNVVWELGTNTGGANADTISEVINIIGNDRNLFLVTPYNGQRLDESGKIADLYRKTAEDNSNVYIIDWRAAVENEPSKYVKTEPGMTVHPTDEGKKLLADLIYKAVTGEGMTGVADCNASVTGTAGEAIAETAIRMSFPEGTDRSMWYHNSGVPEEFTKMAEKWGFDGYPSCSRFASMVILESGVDENFESILRPFGSRKNNLYTLESYFANSPNWEEVSYEESQKGDIIINHEHVEVYIGDEKKAHAGEVGSPSPLDNNGPHIDPLSERDKHGDYKWYRSTNSSGTISVSGSGAGCNVCSADVGGSSDNVVIGEGGLSYEDAVKLMKRYGENKNNASKNAANKQKDMWSVGLTASTSNCGANCVTFSVFFMNKFTDAKPCRGGVKCGDGESIFKYTDNVVVDQDPAVWSVFSYSSNHTGVVLGIHDGECIVGHASYHHSKCGIGDGVTMGSGAGFVKKAATCEAAANLNKGSVKFNGFAHPKSVDEAAIKRFIETGE